MGVFTSFILGRSFFVSFLVLGRLKECGQSGGQRLAHGQGCKVHGVFCVKGCGFGVIYCCRVVFDMQILRQLFLQQLLHAFHIVQLNTGQGGYSR